MKFKKVVEEQGGWSEWLQPTMAGYKMGCCDCGLVHDMEFRVMRVKKNLGSGYVDSRPVPDGKFLVQFRAKRNPRSTGQLRRKHKGAL